MGSDLKDTYGAEGKFAGVLMDPSKLLIVGLDCPVTPELADLADPDRLTKDITGLTGSLYTHGWRGGTVTILKRGPLVYVVDGRQRVRGARAANAKLKADGSDFFIRVPCIPEKSETPTMTLVVANEHRAEDSILAKARKADRLRMLNHSEDEIGVAFNCTRQTLKNWGALLKCIPEVLAQLNAGKIGPSLCYEIGKLDPAKQLEALASAQADGPAKGEEARERVRATGGNSGPRASSNRWKASAIDNLAALLEPTESEPFEDSNHELAYALLQVLRGEDTTAKGLKTFGSVAPLVRRILRSGREEATQTEEE